MPTEGELRLEPSMRLDVPGCFCVLLHVIARYCMLLRVTGCHWVGASLGYVASSASLMSLQMSSADDEMSMGENAEIIALRTTVAYMRQHMAL